MKNYPHPFSPPKRPSVNPIVRDKRFMSMKEDEENYHFGETMNKSFS